MKLKNMIIDEYEQAFPFEQEYNMWIDNMEQDYREECEYRARLTVTNRTNIIIDNEDYSPFITVNS